MLASGFKLNAVSASDKYVWRGISALQLPSSLTDPDPISIILRQHTLDVNSVALKHLTLKGAGKGPAVLITGPPGIGKSMSSLPALVRGLALGQAGPAPPVIIIIELRQLHTVLKLTFNVDPTTRNVWHRRCQRRLLPVLLRLVGNTPIHAPIHQSLVGVRWSTCRQFNRNVTLLSSPVTAHVGVGGWIEKGPLV